MRFVTPSTITPAVCTVVSTPSSIAHRSDRPYVPPVSAFAKWVAELVSSEPAPFEVAAVLVYDAKTDSLVPAPADDEPATTRQRAVTPPIPARPWVSIGHISRPICAVHSRPLDDSAEGQCIVGWSKGETCAHPVPVEADHTPIFPVFGYPEPF